MYGRQAKGALLGVRKRKNRCAYCVFRLVEENDWNGMHYFLIFAEKKKYENNSFSNDIYY